MSEDFGEPVAAEAVVPVPGTQDIRLFGKWSHEDVQLPDISLQDYMAVKDKKGAKFVPHSAGRWTNITVYIKILCYYML